MINLRYYDDGCVGMTLDETTLTDDVRDILYVFGYPDKTTVRFETMH
ncbi:unnamed protein product [Anisakis simplex]|uniref:Phosphoribosylformylglycinamidine synthase n=1 Tax=Anisakis simplex TaxID=6269 RepID=A0A0M3JLB9_ANISI|nr:unnamed protein product [Anisakis simplex]